MWMEGIAIREAVLEPEGRWENISPQTAGLKRSFIRLTVLDRGHGDAKDTAFYTSRMRRFLDGRVPREEVMPLTFGDRAQASLWEA